MILWFSGTGNSRYAAMQLAARLGDKAVQMTPSLPEQPLCLPEGDSRVIWVCPVYSWGIPPYVRSIIACLDLKANGSAPTHHLVLTCGDDCGLAADMWRSDLSHRGWKTAAAYSVTMPNNYVCLKGFDVDSPALRDAKLAAAPARLDAVAKAINAATEAEAKARAYVTADDLVRGRFAWIKTRIIYPWFVRHAMSPRPFRSTEACISCGKCAAICPLDNITMVLPPADSTNPVTDKQNGNRRPRRSPDWGENCAGCLACYHVCPRHAVMYGNSTLNKGQYLNPQSYPQSIEQ